METHVHESFGSADGGLTPDSVFPCQLADRLFGTTRLQPEKRLQVAVLEDAIVTLQRARAGHDSRSNVLRAETEEWFASDATDDPFTFVTICDTLNLDADYVRRGLERWQRRGNGDGPRVLKFRRERTVSGYRIVPNRVRATKVA